MRTIFLLFIFTCGIISGICIYHSRMPKPQKYVVCQNSWVINSVVKSVEYSIDSVKGVF